jgi:hypothetical protein
VDVDMADKKCNFDEKLHCNIELKNMNHQKIYESIVENARKQNRTRNDNVYYEDHHIIPRCLGGSDDPHNKVLLTAKEHFVCHKLLTYIYKGNYKIYHAFHLMAFMNKRKYELTSRDYAYAIELFRKIPQDHVGDKNPMYGKKQSKESIEKNRKSNLGSYKERYGREKSDVMKEKLSKKSKGKNNPMYDKSFYDVWVIKHGKEEADKRREKFKQNKKNKIWVKKLQKSKQIRITEIDTYLSNGWEKGRILLTKRKPCSDETRRKLSKKRKEYWERKKK